MNNSVLDRRKSIIGMFSVAYHWGLLPQASQISHARFEDMELLGRPSTLSGRHLALRGNPPDIVVAEIYR